MREVASKHFWWPLVNQQIQLTAPNCTEYCRSGKNSKPVIPVRRITKTYMVEESNQEFQSELLEPLPALWGANNRDGH